MAIYEEVKEKALPLIKAYHDDLIKHDRKTIAENPGVPFLHFTGDTGTHLVSLIPAEDYPAKGELVEYLFGVAGRVHILKQAVLVVQCMKKVNRQDLILYFDGEKLREITQEKAELITWEYQERILLEWRKEKSDE